MSREELVRKFSGILEDEIGIDLEYAELVAKDDIVPEIERLLADERGRAEIDTKVYWGIELDCGHIRMNLVNYPETGSTVCRACMLEKRIIEAEREKVRVEALYDIKTLVDNQANDSGLWFRAQTAPEGYLQQELRRLHAVIERQLDLTTSLAPSTDEGGK